MLEITLKSELYKEAADIILLPLLLFAGRRKSKPKPAAAIIKEIIFFVK
jgi:hypothetical protein